MAVEFYTRSGGGWHCFSFDEVRICQMRKPKKPAKKDVSASYNRTKKYQGKQYTGLAVGRGHKWYYDKGAWIDRKVTPDKWLISYAVTKRRAGKAPEGSGAAVGTEYHWYILAHQMVKKLDANSYSTALNGFKFKLAHKRSGKEKWNITDSTQRKHLIKILKDFIKELDSEPIDEFVEESRDIIAAAKKSKTAEQLPKATVKRKKKTMHALDE